MSSFHGELITTGAVITEAFHFLGPDRRGISAFVDFLEQPEVRRLDCFSPEALIRARNLMDKYAKAPMDFADATLVWTAEETRTDDILTLDERGFRTYRHGRRRSFRLVLQDHLSGDQPGSIPARQFGNPGRPKGWPQKTRKGTKRH